MHEADLPSPRESSISLSSREGAQHGETSPRSELPSATDADWSRESCEPFAWKPARQLLASVRAYRRATEQGGVRGRIMKKAAVLRHRFWSAVTGADIPINAENLGGGLLIPHPTGVVIHPEAKVGPNCLIFQNVTLGTGSRPGLPTLKGHVDVGAGAKILGGVVIGEHAVIGANAVVIDDVPPGAHATGVPAVIHYPRR
jgi:serine O-acetyltransferase